MQALRQPLESIKDKASSAADSSASAYSVSGRERQTGQPAKVFYFGSCHHLPFAMELVFDEYSIDREFAGLRQWQARKWLARYESEVDLLVADLTWPYHRLLPRQKYIEIPAWLCQRLPLRRTWEEVRLGFRKSAKTTALRRVRKFGLTCRMTNDLDAASRFYHEMYVPYLEKRFGDVAFIEPESRIRDVVEVGGLLEVVRDDRVIAGAVLYGHFKSLQFLWVGVEEGLEAQIPEGAFAALYYYAIEHAFTSGYREVDLSGTRALLNDGVYRFKRQWGARVYDGWSLDSVLIKVVNANPQVRAFLEANPMIVRKKGELQGKILYLEKRPSASEIHRCEKSFDSPGIQRLKVFSTQGFDQGAVAAARSSESPIQLIDLASADDPIADYCAG